LPENIYQLSFQISHDSFVQILTIESRLSHTQVHQ